MAFQLPRFLALKSDKNNRYLRYIHQGIQSGILQFSGENVLSPYAKFEVEAAASDSSLVHIRSCYNNKYLRRADEDSLYIVAGAVEQQQDRNQWSCTLFEPVRVEQQPDSNSGNIGTFRFRHVQLGHFIELFSATDFQEFLFAGQPIYDNENADVFMVIDLEKLVILPKHLAFKGDNGEYLRVQFLDGHPYLQFSANDPTDPMAGFEVVNSFDGSVLIRSTPTQNFWRRNTSPHNSNLNNFIWVDTNDNANNSDDTLFWPVIVDSNNNGDIVVALRNLGNNKFCQSFTDAGAINSLNAASPAITRGARLAVKELVLSRSISDLNFHLADARIYNHEIDLVVAIGESTNPNQQPAKKLISLSYIDTKTSTWKTNADDVAFTSLIYTTLTSKTLFVVHDNRGERIEVLANFNGVYKWGQIQTSRTPIGSKYPVVVPPKSTVKVSLLATKASCDIPFDYSQQDTDIIGQNQPPNNKEGGVYTGVSFCKFHYKTAVTPLQG